MQRGSFAAGVGFGLVAVAAAASLLGTASMAWACQPDVCQLPRPAPRDETGVAANVPALAFRLSRDNSTGAESSLPIALEDGQGQTIPVEATPDSSSPGDLLVRPGAPLLAGE